MSRMRIQDIEIRDADIFEILLDNFPDMIHSIDQEGNIVYTNRTASILLGYSGEELLQMNVREIYADEVLKALEKGFSDLKEKGDKRVESLLKAKDGTEIPVEIRSFSIYDDEGNFLRTFSILRDIREIKELQNSLVHAGRLAAIGELSSGVAHDINNPLTVILLSNEMMLKELERDHSDPISMVEKVTGHATDIQRASKSIQKLADHLRTFSRGMAEKYENLDLFDVLADALFITSNKINRSGITFENSLKKGDLIVNGMSNQLEQVFINMIGNACDAMTDSEKRKLSIKASSTEWDDVPCWRIEFSDTGKGIPEDLHEDVFHSFFTTKEKGKGTGLGLSISRGIIRDHKGEIYLESKEGKGSSFFVLLPKVES
jgi:two-component system NtrC family sensor kinase